MAFSLCLCVFTWWCLFVSMSKFLYSKDISHWIMAHPYPRWPHLTLITCAKTLFQNKVTCIRLRVRILTYLSWGHNSTHDSSAVAMEPRRILTSLPFVPGLRSLGSFCATVCPWMGTISLSACPHPHPAVHNIEHWMDKSEPGQGCVGVGTAQACFTLCPQCSSSSLSSLSLW